VDAHGNPVRMLITKGTTADCTQAGKLIEGIDADNLIADKGYDTDEVVDLAQDAGMQAVIPPKKKIGKNNGNMTNISIPCDTWLKMPFYT